MVHAPTRDQCEDIGRDIAAATGITDNLLLYSTREYKKTRVRYFVEDHEGTWDTAEAAEALAETGRGLTVASLNLPQSFIYTGILCLNTTPFT